MADDDSVNADSSGLSASSFWGGSFTQSFAKVTNVVKNVERSFESVIGIPENAEWPSTAEEEEKRKRIQSEAEKELLRKKLLQEEQAHQKSSDGEEDGVKLGASEMEISVADDPWNDDGWSVVAEVEKKDMVVDSPSDWEREDQTAEHVKDVVDSAEVQTEYRAVEVEGESDDENRSILEPERNTANETSDSISITTDGRDTASALDAPPTSANLEHPASGHTDKECIRDDVCSSASSADTRESVTNNSVDSWVGTDSSSEACGVGENLSPHLKETDKSAISEESTVQSLLETDAGSGENLFLQERIHANDVKDASTATPASAVSTASPSKEAQYKKALLQLKKKLKSQKAVIAERERQIESSLQAQTALNEEKLRLQKELRAAKDRCETIALKQGQDSEAAVDMESLKDEFSQRLGQLEKKLAKAQDEKAELKQQLESKEASPGENAEKDKEIAELRMEGTKLSEKQLKLEGILKKLRVKEKEQETKIADLTSRLDSSEGLLETKVKRVKELEESDRKYAETMSNMKQITETNARKLEERSQALEKAQQQVADLQTALEKSWRDLAEQKKNMSGQDSVVRQKIVEAQEDTKEMLRSKFREKEQQYREREIEHEKIIRDLRTELERVKERMQWREDDFNKEIQELRGRVQSADMRNEDLRSGIAEATRPLLRQIEALQSSADAKQHMWDELETSMNNRMKDLQERLRAATEKERLAIDESNEAQSRIKTLESQVSSERSQVAQLNAKMELMRADLEEAQQDCAAAKASLHTAEDRYQREIRNLQASNAKLTTQLNQAKDRSSALKAEQDKNLKKMQELQRTVSKNEQSGSETKASFTPTGLRIGSDLRIVDSPTHTMTSAGHEQMRTALKQKDGEIQSLQKRLSEAESVRSSLEDELVKLTNRIEQLSDTEQAAQKLHNDYEELKRRHLTCMELLGEKEELVEELRADLADVKALSRMQVDALASQLEELRRT